MTLTSPHGICHHSPDWLKSKNPACAEVKRKVEEEWGT